MPVLKEERRRAGEAGCAMLRRMRTLLIREPSLVNPLHLENLNKTLEQYGALNIVYQFRLRLQNIWAKRTATQAELLEALQDWCRQAEASGIKVLNDFVNQLKAYMPQRA